jgi:hypothetical protein
MVKRITAIGLAVLGTLAVLLSSGCGPDTDLTGTPIPNSMPDTEVTARPPDVLEAGFVVQFYWSGFDPDGRIVGYQWKMSDNGVDGISLRDTLTFDPATGDTLNPWTFTASTDSTFLVSADIPDFPNDPEGYDRSFQTHTFLVRAVDEDGGVDPTPAYISFNSTTLLPTIVLTGPSAVTGQVESAQLPSTVTMLYEGSDPDFEAGLPTEVRYLWKRAVLPNGDYADTRNDFNNNLDFLVSFDDSAWTDWKRYDPDDDTRREVLPDQQQTDSQGRRIMYLFAVQARDTAGAVSIGRNYGAQIANVSITNSLAPQIFVFEQFLGAVTGSGTNLERNIDIAAGQELNFAWGADASGYAGIIESFRYGWDLSDVNDPNDPNWALPPGTSDQHRRAQPIAFNSGVHTLTIQVVDNSSQMTRINYTLNVVPVPDPSNQLPLLLVDDVYDRNSSSWRGPLNEALDNDIYRDLFWRTVLGGPGGVAGWDSLANTFDSEEESIEYRDAVRYRALVWTGRWAGEGTTISARFRPEGGSSSTGDIDKYIWLTPYQETVGNLLYVGSRAAVNYLANSSYELPIVFESREGRRATGYESVRGVNVRRGFGYRDLPDGSEELVGLTRYPYATLGLSVVDLFSPSGLYYEYDTGVFARTRRKAACAAMKGLVIDDEFRANYFPGGGVVADTVWTESYIDHFDDPDPAGIDVLQFAYEWGDDEFYNTDAVSRNTPFTIQLCETENGVQDCIEPMFRSIARFDWVQIARREIDPDDTWPDGYYGGTGQLDLSALCGNRSLNPARTDAITTDRVVAFITHKTAPEKPSQVGDVVFGFDPYRFDNEEMRKIVRWTLGEYFGLSMTAEGK